MWTLLKWWAERMGELIPHRFSARTGVPRRALVAVLDVNHPRSLTLFRQERRGRRLLGEIGLAEPGRGAIGFRFPSGLPRTTILECPAGLLLERKVDLPIAAEHDLHRLLGCEMDRITPFQSADVFWSGSVSFRDAVHGRLVVHLVVLPRARVQPIISALSKVQLSVASIISTDARAHLQTIDLSSGSPSPRGWARQADALAIGLCGVLALIAAYLPFALQDAALAEVHRRIGALRPVVADVENFRREAARFIDSKSAVAAARAEIGSSLQALAFLSAALPDDTYLTHLSAKQRTLSVGGRSMHAARLIAGLSSNPALQDSAFTGPVIHDETTGTEQFSLNVTVAP